MGSTWVTKKRKVSYYMNNHSKARVLVGTYKRSPYEHVPAPPEGAALGAALGAAVAGALPTPIETEADPDPEKASTAMTW